MDTLVSNGDFAIDVCGLPHSIDSVEEACQRVEFILSIKKGSYIYNRDLGCDFSSLKTADNKEKTAWLLCREALVSQNGIEIGNVGIVDDNTLSVEVLYKGEKKTAEVRYNADV